ncbi:MAG: poly(3-hydroxybutyrate) depolymerase, partial [Pseudomonadota bacterium]
AHSQLAEKISGAGAVLARLTKAMNSCMQDKLRHLGVPDVGGLASLAQKFSERRDVDALHNLQGDKIYLYSAEADTTVVGSIVSAARDFYEEVGVPPQNVLFLRKQSGAHAFITRTDGDACGTAEPPYINACDYDQAGAVLKHIHGALVRPSAKKFIRTDENFLVFDQRPFFAGMRNHDLAKHGFLFRPQSCVAEPGCAVHIVFHGCAQSDNAVFTDVALRTGYLRWAQENRLIVLFPHAKPSKANPKGCWDWWGVTGDNYLTKQAPQIRAVRAMLAHLATAG